VETAIAEAPPFLGDRPQPFAQTCIADPARPVTDRHPHAANHPARPRSLISCACRNQDEGCAGRVQNLPIINRGNSTRLVRWIVFHSSPKSDQPQANCRVAGAIAAPPISQTKFSTARRPAKFQTLGITIPPALLGVADEVIE